MREALAPVWLTVEQVRILTLAALAPLQQQRLGQEPLTGGCRAGEAVRLLDSEALLELIKNTSVDAQVLAAIEPVLSAHPAEAALRLAAAKATDEPTLLRMAHRGDADIAVTLIRRADITPQGRRRRHRRDPRVLRGAPGRSPPRGLPPHTLLAVAAPPHFQRHHRRLLR